MWNFFLNLKEIIELVGWLATLMEEMKVRGICECSETKKANKYASQETQNRHARNKIELVCCCLKLVSAIFFQIFIFHQMIALYKLWKMFFLSSKKLFSFSRYSSFSIFVFPSFSPCQPLLWRLIQEKS